MSLKLFAVAQGKMSYSSERSIALCQLLHRVAGCLNERLDGESGLLRTYVTVSELICDCVDLFCKCFVD